MKSKLIVMLFIFLGSISCKEANSPTFELVSDVIYINKNHDKNFELPKIAVIQSRIPVKISCLDFKDQSHLFYISDGKNSVIENSIKEYYIDECGGDSTSLFSIKEVYIGTIQINNESNLILYWIIYRHISSKVNSEILFFDNTKKEFLKCKLDLNIHALYNESEGKLEPSNLKKLFKIESPEIELVCYEENGDATFRFTRLYHNGTANAIEQAEIKVNENGLDTVKFEQNWK